VVSSTGDLPAGLIANQAYYVITPTTSTFQLSLSQNGSAVDITSNGTGTITASVITKIAEFPWENVLGWSNTKPAFF
jgi:hypothetical protein